MIVLNENPGTREEMKINALATNGVTLPALSPQSVVVERVIFVVFTLLVALILIDAALELIFPVALTGWHMYESRMNAGPFDCSGATVNDRSANVGRFLEQRRAEPSQVVR
jgi:hypothetical protein